jgi:hypothetical protein
MILYNYYTNDSKIEKTENKIESNSKSSSTEDEYNNISFFKKSFVEGCIDDDDSKEKTIYWECAFDNLIKKMPKETIINEALKYDETGIMSEKLKNNMIDAAINCL